jgi:DNA-binding response OmpR family regulator
MTHRKNTVMIDEDSAPKKTAVIVEDDPDVLHLLAGVLESAGFSAITADNGLDGVQAVLEHQPLITTLDVNMPGIDGIEAARRIRAQSDTYIIMLTALDEEADVVLGLSAGADEYLNKPFRPRELRARIESLLRRPRTGAMAAALLADQVASSSAGAERTAGGGADAGGAGESDAGPHTGTSFAAAVRNGDAAESSDGPWIRHRDLQLSPATRIALVGDREVDLTRTEFDLLAALLETKRRVRSKADLALMLRGESYVTSYYVGEADKRAVEAHMTNLRRKLGDNPAQPRYIETVRGVGYRLTSESAG